MAHSSKKVILRTMTDDIYPGYLPVSGMIEVESGHPSVTLFDLDGRIVPIPLAEVRWIAYVRDFNLTDKDDPERLTRRTFLARPRTEGLWLKLTMTDGSIFEGLAPIDLTLVDGLLDDKGIFLIPPDNRSNTQRLYIPRHEIRNLKLLAVITTPSKPKSVSADQESKQAPLFPEPNRS